MVILQDNEEDYTSSSEEDYSEEEDEEEELDEDGENNENIIMDHPNQNNQHPHQHQHNHPHNLQHLPISKLRQLRLLIERCIKELNHDISNSNTITALTHLFGSTTSTDNAATAAVNSLHGILSPEQVSFLVGVSSTATFAEIKRELRVQKIDNYMLKNLISYQLQLVNIQTDEIEKRERKNYRLVEKIKRLKKALAQSREEVATLRTSQRLIGRHEQGTQTSPQNKFSQVGKSTSGSNVIPSTSRAYAYSGSSVQNRSHHSSQTSDSESSFAPPPAKKRRESGELNISISRSRKNVSESRKENPKKSEKDRSRNTRRRDRQTSLSSDYSDDDDDDSRNSSPAPSSSKHASPTRTRAPSPRTLRKRTDAPLYFPPPPIRRPSFTSNLSRSNDAKDVPSPNTSASSSPSTSMFNNSFFANLGKKTTPIIVTNWPGSSKKSTESGKSERNELKSKCVELSQRAAVQLDRSSTDCLSSKLQSETRRSRIRSSSPPKRKRSISDITSDSDRSERRPNVQKHSTSSKSLQQSETKLKKASEKQKDRLKKKPNRGRELRTTDKKRDDLKSNDNDVIFLSERINKKNDWPPGIAPDEEDNCLMTKTPYFTLEKSEEILEKANEEEDVKAVDGETVVVPSWRVLEFPALKYRYLDEETDDNTYLKRHAKFEVDEKRRKRWDAQKQREENYIRQLKENQAKKALRYKKRRARANVKAATGIAIPDDDITALLPDPENAKYIRIEENIPVTAFGYLVPPVEKNEYKRPWITSGSQSESELTESEKEQDTNPQPSTSKAAAAANTGTSGGTKVTLTHVNRRFSSKPSKK